MPKLTKPDAATAMRQLITRIRDTLPFDTPAARVCEGPCDGCSMKLLDYMESELESWEQRLDQGERPGLAELSKLAKSARRIYQVMQRNGLVETAY